MTETDDVVVISEAMPGDESVATNYTWVRPSDPGWNDFGHHARAIIGKVIDRRLVYEYQAKAAFLDDTSGTFLGVGEALDRLGTDGIIITERHHVVTLAESQESYRRIIGELGVEDGVQLLQCTNDLVAITGNQKFREFERRVRDSHVFKYSLVRTSEAFYALRNSKPILRGLSQEDTSSGPTSVAIAIPDQNGGEVGIVFDFKHDDVMPKRTCVLIGKNGVGKSTALGNIARKAVRGIQLGAADIGDRVVASRVLAFTPGNEFTGTFPSETAQNPSTFYKRLSTSRMRNSRSGNTASASIVELSRYENDIAEKSRFNIFLDAVLAISNSEEIALRSNSSDRYIFLKDLRLRSEERRLLLQGSVNQAVEPGRVTNDRFYHLSTGEVRFIKLLSQACMFIENGSLILLDEPETHLHPNFIARLMSALESLLSDTGSCAIVATHSVYVVREVFHDQVFIVEKGHDGRVGIRAPGMRTFGADLSSISSFIFAEDGHSFLATDTIKRLREACGSFDEVKEKYGPYLSREVLSVIKEKFEV